MYYQRTNKIEDRFKLAVTLILGFKANTETLAKQLGVSRPTIIRIVNELRRRGFIINAVRDSKGWHYEAIQYLGRPLPSLDNWVKKYSSELSKPSDTSVHPQPNPTPTGMMDGLGAGEQITSPTNSMKS